MSTDENDVTVGKSTLSVERDGGNAVYDCVAALRVAAQSSDELYYVWCRDVDDDEVEYVATDGALTLLPDASQQALLDFYLAEIDRLFESEPTR